MTALVQRDDLSARTALSKSTLAAFDYCQSAAWFDLHYRQPLIPAERLTFGSAADAAVEQAIAALRDTGTVDHETCMAAAAEVVERDGTGVNLDEVDRAVTGFVVEVAPHYDFTGTRLQERLAGELPDLGEVDGHPDVWLGDGRIYDVKTTPGNKGKADDPTLELGFYALLAQEVRREPVHEVGYWTFIRGLKTPRWEVKAYSVTPELLRWTVEKAAAYIRAKRADEALNRNAETPINWSMTGGPTFASKCLDCQYASICTIARRGEAEDAA